MSNKYDFIIVGAGPAGSVVASRLANSLSRPSVLLLEAGGSNESSANLSPQERFSLAFSPNSPLNWNYKTTPQNQLNSQEIDYSRGKGLGGSTAINFCGWLVGARDDYDEWARRVGDESFNWKNVRRCLDTIENLHPEIPDESMRRYVDAKIEDHSISGALDLTYGEQWDPEVSKIYSAAEQSNLPMNKDTNSGNPLGMGMGTVCVYKGQRLTSAIAYLQNPPPNLTIIPHAAVAKVLLQEKTAVGVRTIDGREFFANREVILSGGALNSPQLLLLSGIGPKDELAKHSIPLVHELPKVGRDLQDHCFSTSGIVLRKDPKTPDFPMQSPTPMAFLKSPNALSSTEFKELSLQTQIFLQAPTVPSFEIASHIPPTYQNFISTPETKFVGAFCILMNPQSRGSVTLQSSDPSAAPLIDPNFLSHAYDRRSLIEGIREIKRILSAPVYVEDTIEHRGPESDSDEAIWEHIRQNTFSSWHMSCTVQMGTTSETACVDSSFRVFGLDSLRVVDLSVCPFVTNNHTQSTAYVLGEIAAEKLIKQHNLAERSAKL